MCQDTDESPNISHNSPDTRRFFPIRVQFSISTAPSNRNFQDSAPIRSIFWSLSVWLPIWQPVWIKTSSICIHCKSPSIFIPPLPPISIIPKFPSPIRLILSLLISILLSSPAPNWSSSAFTRKSPSRIFIHPISIFAPCNWIASICTSSPSSSMTNLRLIRILGQVICNVWCSILAIPVFIRDRSPLNSITPLGFSFSKMMRSPFFVEKLMSPLRLMNLIWLGLLTIRSFSQSIP